MDKIREAAVACIGRAVMFGTLAIGCVMVAFSFNLVSALRAGAVLTLGMAAILIFKALSARRQHPRDTEVWLYLADEHRPADDRQRSAFAAIMRDVYGRFAQVSLFAACAMFAVSVVLLLFGFEPYQPPLAPALAAPQ